MSDILDRAEAALEGVTDGPWVIERDESTHLAYDLPIYDAKQSPLAVCPDCGVRGGFELPSAEFIAAARSLIPELVAEIERLQALVKPRCTCNLGDAFHTDFHQLACALRTDRP